ncbi:MAG: Mth938-like domain-containing protein [Planctomycetota bacterium]|jgi:hypothetical protein
MKLRIDEYSFGRMTVGEREFRSDIILYPDGHVQDNWRRGQGHNLLPNDISKVLEEAPEKLVIGTGDSGMMRVSEGVLELCKNRGIEVVVCRTAVAKTKFNEAAEAGTVVAACFHLTC